MNTLQKQVDPKNLGLRADEDIREQMWHRLPRWLQPILTEVTGKAAMHETAPWRWTWWSRLAVSFFWLTVATLASAWLVQQSPLWWLLFPIPWVVATSVMQTFQTGYLHHASHRALSGKRWLDRFVGEALSVLIFIRPLAEYQPEHMLHHGRLALTEDVDLRFIANFFEPGKSRHFYWAQLWCMIFSPVFHAQWLANRLQANFVTASLLRRAAAAAYVGGLAILVIYVGIWTVFFAWLLPIFVLLQASLLLEVVTEHTWVRRDNENARLSIANLTHGRFFGEPLPSRDSVVAWAGWWLRLGLIHLPSRMLVAPGDLANHDFHHRHPVAQEQWPNAAYARRDDLLQSHEGWPAYSETWGVFVMFNKTFAGLSQLPCDAKLGHPETYGK